MGTKKDGTGEPGDLPRSGGEAGSLIVEPDHKGEKEQFNAEVERTLKETEEAVVGSGVIHSAQEAHGWQRAREVVSHFRPVPWFIWRLSNYVLGAPGRINPLSEGLVFGLRRLVFATASDPILGGGVKIDNVRRALEVIPADVLAAVAVIHAVNRRLAQFQFERIWRPIIEDAIIRARLGFLLGVSASGFGSGRAMLAGFAGRCGLAISIAGGELQQAQRALEMLAVGGDIQEVGRDIYGCDPLQISAMTLSAAGCGRDAAFGTVNYSIRASVRQTTLNEEQLRWLAAFTIIEYVRAGRQAEVDPSYWAIFNISESEGPSIFAEEAKTVLRRGHGWGWLV